jgi:hypothetical protein
MVCQSCCRGMLIRISYLNCMFPDGTQVYPTSFFADDTLLFMKINAEQAHVIRDALRCYERCTGQLISLGKCSIMFGAHCQQENTKRVKEILQAPNVTTEEKYLGLPTPQGRMNKDKFK